MDHPFNVLSLCSGSGAFDIGVGLAIRNARTVCYVEREAYAVEVLASRCENGELDPAPIWTDLRTFDGKPWRGVVDCVIAGYPCQPFSLAGEMRGEADPRHLWPDVARIIRETAPQFVFLENVAAHVDCGFDTVVGDLRRMGFGVKAGIFAALETSATHLRQRLFVLAYADGIRPEIQRAERQLHRGDSQGETSGMGADYIPLFPPRSDDLEAWARVLPLHPDLEPALCRMDDGLADWMERLQLVGNGVSPLQAAYAIAALAAAIGD